MNKVQGTNEQPNDIVLCWVKCPMCRERHKNRILKVGFEAMNKPCTKRYEGMDEFGKKLYQMMVSEGRHAVLEELDAFVVEAFKFAYAKNGKVLKALRRKEVKLNDSSLGSGPSNARREGRTSQTRRQGV